MSRLPITTPIINTPYPRLNEIADKLVRGRFIYIWSTPDGLPYCPRQSIAMMSYLWTVRFSHITTQDRLNTLKDILNSKQIDPARRDKIRRVMALVFPTSGAFALSPNDTNNSTVNSTVNSRYHTEVTEPPNWTHPTAGFTGRGVRMGV